MPLRLVEVRGALPKEITCPETGVTFRTDKKGGTMPKKSTFTCGACGTDAVRPLPLPLPLPLPGLTGKRDAAAGKAVAPAPRDAGITGLTGGAAGGVAIGGRGVGVDVIELRNGPIGIGSGSFAGAGAGAGAAGLKAMGCAGFRG